MLQLRDVTARDQRFDWSIRVTCGFSPERVYKSEQFLGLVTCENRLLKKGKVLAKHGLKRNKSIKSVSFVGYYTPFLRESLSFYIKKAPKITLLMLAKRYGDASKDVYVMWYKCLQQAPTFHIYTEEMLNKATFKCNRQVCRNTPLQTMDGKPTTEKNWS